MERWTVVVLQVVIALALAGSLVVQTVMMPTVWVDLAGEALWGRIALVSILVLEVVAAQVCGVCLWALLTKVRRGSLLGPASFRYLDVMAGALFAAAALALLLAVLLAPGTIAPGVVALICGAALVLGGSALLVVVLRGLLRQAIAREDELGRLRARVGPAV